jgi:hypothetical protein
VEEKMKKTDLIALGIEDEEVVKQVIILHGKDIESLKARAEKAETELLEANQTIEGFREMDIDSVKSAAEEWKAKAEKAEADLLAANQTIDGFKAMDIGAVQAAAEEWKAKAEKAEADLQEGIRAVRFEYEIDRALTAAKAKNPKAVRALLDLGSVQFNEEGVLEGLDSQLEAIKEENDYLFESETPVPRVVSGANSKSVMDDATVDAARRAAGLAQ